MLCSRTNVLDFITSEDRNRRNVNLTLLLLLNCACALTSHICIRNLHTEVSRQFRTTKTPNEYLFLFGSRRRLSALQSESCKREMTWPHFSWGCLLLERDNPLPEKCTIYPSIITSLPAICAVLHPLTMHFCRRIVVLPPCCLQIRSAGFSLVGVILTNQQRAPVWRPFVPFRFLSGMSGKLSCQGVKIVPILN